MEPFFVTPQGFAALRDCCPGRAMPRGAVGGRDPAAEEPADPAAVEGIARLCRRAARRQLGGGSLQ